MSPRGESSGHLVRPVGPLAVPTYVRDATLPAKSCGTASTCNLVSDEGTNTIVGMLPVI